jgi:hypothetical protein
MGRMSERIANDEKSGVEERRGCPKWQVCHDRYRKDREGQRQTVGCRNLRARIARPSLFSSSLSSTTGHHGFGRFFSPLSGSGPSPLLNSLRTPNVTTVARPTLCIDRETALDVRHGNLWQGGAVQSSMQQGTADTRLD